MPRPLLIILALVAVTFATYWPVHDLGFVSYDDTSYVSMQPMVNQGLREAAVCWAFTSVHGANWHPLTSLSHMLDVTLFGVQPGPMHWENALSPMLVTPSPIVTLVRPVQPENAASPRLSTFVGMVTRVKAVQR